MRHELVIPALALERAALRLIRASHDGEGASVARAVAERRVTSDRTIWYADDFASAPGATAWRQMSNLGGQAIVNLWWLESRDDPPSASHAWPKWVRSNLPDWRAIAPNDMALHVVLCADGVIDGFIATSAVVSGQTGWSRLHLLRLPGPRMRRLALVNVPDATSTSTRAGDVASGRFSRLAGAQGPDVVASSQDLVILVVGAGRTGSAVSHTLARNGHKQILLDVDTVEAHNASDGDLLIPSLHEGLPKAHSVAKAARALLRPGAWIDARQLDVRSDAAQIIAQEADILISCVDNDESRLACMRLSKQYRLPHLDLGVGMPIGDRSAGIDIRLTLPGSGCLMCVGGLASPRLRDNDGLEPGQSDFGVRRRGSARTLSVTAANMGVRLLEQLFEGRVRQSRFVQVTEEASTGVLRLEDSSHGGRAGCLFCDATANSTSSKARD